MQYSQSGLDYNNIAENVDTCTVNDIMHIIQTKPLTQYDAHQIRKRIQSLSGNRKDTVIMNLILDNVELRSIIESKDCYNYDTGKLSQLTQFEESKPLNKSILLGSQYNKPQIQQNDDTKNYQQDIATQKQNYFINKQQNDEPFQIQHNYQVDQQIVNSLIEKSPNQSNNLQNLSNLSQSPFNNSYQSSPKQSILSSPAKSQKTNQPITNTDFLQISNIYELESMLNRQLAFKLISSTKSKQIQQILNSFGSKKDTFRYIAQFSKVQKIAGVSCYYQFLSILVYDANQQLYVRVFGTSSSLEFLQLQELQKKHLLVNDKQLKLVACDDVQYAIGFY